MSVIGSAPGSPAASQWLQRLRADTARSCATLVRPPRMAAARLQPTARGRLAAVTIVAVAVLAAAMLLVDTDAITLMRGLPEGFVAIVNEFTDFGRSGWFLIPLAGTIVVIAIAAARPAVSRFTRLVAAAIVVRLGFVFLAIAVPGLIVAVVKRLIGRARPFVTGEADPFAYFPFAWRAEYASIPSGHATTAFAAAVAIGVIWPRARAAMWSFAVLIALSRVVVLAHHPSDVLAGALAGGIGALLVRNWFAVRRLGFAVGRDGAIRPLPGPSRNRLKAVARRLAGS